MWYHSVFLERNALAQKCLNCLNVVKMHNVAVPSWSRAWSWDGRGRMNMSMSKEGTIETDSNPKFSAKFKTLGRIKELKGLLGPAVACLRFS